MHRKCILRWFGVTKKFFGRRFDVIRVLFQSLLAVVWVAVVSSWRCFRLVPCLFRFLGNVDFKRMPRGWEFRSRIQRQKIRSIGTVIAGTGKIFSEKSKFWVNDFRKSLVEFSMEIFGLSKGPPYENKNFQIFSKKSFFCKVCKNDIKRWIVGKKCILRWFGVTKIFFGRRFDVIPGAFWFRLSVLVWGHQKFFRRRFDITPGQS